jgi:hypothetical protein
MKIPDLFRDISELFRLPRTKCSKCKRSYSDFAVDLDKGTVTCVGCGNSSDIVEELGRDQAVLILDAVLTKGDLTPEQRYKVEQLRRRIGAT